jgi:hypothetical protein
LAFKEEGAPASSGIKHDTQIHNAHFSSAAAAALKTPIPYSELSIGTLKNSPGYFIFFSLSLIDLILLQQLSFFVWDTIS